jgi:hypothetical protein
VSLRISSHLAGECTVIQVDGQLRDDGVGELERMVADLVGPLRLDLSGLRSADEAGLAALRALRAKGAALAQASPYIALLLDPGAGPPSGRRTSRRRKQGKPGREDT